MNSLKFLNQKKLIYAINEETLFSYKPEESDFLSEKKVAEYGLKREINIEKLEIIFKDSLDATKVSKFTGINDLDPTHYDCYLGIHLHYYLRLSRAEASRPEVWNSIIFQNSFAKEYIKQRGLIGSSKFNIDSTNLLVKNLNDLHRRNFISAAWWITELTRNGNDYDYSKKAFNCTRVLLERFGTLNYFHNQLLALATAEFFHNFDKRVSPTVISRRDALAVPPNFGVSIKDFINSRNIEVIYEPIKINTDKFVKWQSEKTRNMKTIKGPDDFKVKKLQIDKVVNEFESLAQKRGWIS